MANGDAIVMNNFKEQLLKKDMDFANGTFKIALYHTTLGTPDGSGPSYSTTNEIVVSGYTAGGKTISGIVVTQDDTNNRAKCDDDGSNITWTNLGATTITEARLYVDGDFADWLLILYEVPNSNGQNYTLNFHSDGIFWLT